MSTVLIGLLKMAMEETTAATAMERPFLVSAFL